MRSGGSFPAKAEVVLHPVFLGASIIAWMLNSVRAPAPMGDIGGNDAMVVPAESGPNGTPIRIGLGLSDSSSL